MSKPPNLMKIRDAAVSDIALVAKCVVAAAHLCDFGDNTEYDEEFTEICARDDTLYSYRHARVITVSGDPGSEAFSWKIPSRWACPRDSDASRSS